jgi:hypothetical protein
MITDIYINDMSMMKMGWIRENIEFPVPESQTETVVVPGRNAPIRFSEALGMISFKPRVFTITLSMLGTRSQFDAQVFIASNQYAGRLCKVRTSEEPNLYVIGTLQLIPSYDPLSGKGQLVLECSDGDSYRYHVDMTEIIQTASGTVILKNDYMPVVPTVITTADTTLSWKVGTDSFNKTLSAGEWEIPELQLSYGNSSVKVTSTGDTTFRYREGCL